MTHRLNFVILRITLNNHVQFILSNLTNRLRDCVQRSMSNKKKMQLDVEESTPVSALTLQFVRKTRKEPLNVRGCPALKGKGLYSP